MCIKIYGYKRDFNALSFSSAFIQDVENCFKRFLSELLLTDACLRFIKTFYIAQVRQCSCDPVYLTGRYRFQFWRAPGCIYPKKPTLAASVNITFSGR